MIILLVVCFTFTGVASYSKSTNETENSSKGLVIHLPFDGDIKPARGSLPKVFNSPKFVKGKFGKAISLTDNAYLLLKLPEDVCDGDFSISFWMKPLWHPLDGVFHPIFEIPANPKKEDKIKWAQGQVLFSKGWSRNISPDGINGVVSASHARRFFSPGKWVHVLLVYNAKKHYFASYFNGEGWQRPMKKRKSPIFYNNELWLGTRRNSHGCADIILDDFRIYNYALNQEEIEKVAMEKFPPPRDNLMDGSRCNSEKFVESPHVKWAKPLTGGDLKVLCIAEGFRCREFFEAAQRLAIKPLVMGSPRFDNSILKNPSFFKDFGKRIRDNLKKYHFDCIVLSAFGWNLLDEETRQCILDYVKKGGGLLFVDPRCIACPGANKNIGHGVRIGWETTREGAKIEKMTGRLPKAARDYLTCGIPWNVLSMFRFHFPKKTPDSLFRGAIYGKGRILLYDINTGGVSGGLGLTPDTQYNMTVDLFDYDYAIGAVGKSLYWTARGLPKVQIENVEFDIRNKFYRELTVGSLGCWTVKLYNNTKNTVRASLSLTVRNSSPEPEDILKRNLKLKPGSNVVRFKYRLKRKGLVFADGRVSISDCVSDWGTGVAEVRAGNPYISSVELNRKVFRTGEIPAVKIKVVDHKYGSPKKTPGIINWRLFDNFGRIVAKGEKPFLFPMYKQFKGLVKIFLPPLYDGSLCYHLEVKIRRKNGNCTDQVMIPIYVKKGSQDRMVFCSYGSISTAPRLLATKLLRDKCHLSSISCITSGRPMNNVFLEKLELANRLNLRPWIYATNLGHGPDKEFKRLPDFADEYYLSRLSGVLGNIAEACEKVSPLFYSLGDEVKSGPRDAHPTGKEQDAFRAYLRIKYGSIKKLNDAWGTSCKAWKEVRIPTSNQLLKGKVAGSVRREVYDFRQKLFSNMVGCGTDAIRIKYPDAKVGIEGVFGLQHHWGTVDYWRLTRNSTFVGLYAMGMEMDMVRSFQSHTDLLECWYNYKHNDKNYSLNGPWHALLRGVDVFGWYTTYSGNFFTMLNPDFTFYEQFKWSYSELEPILKGIGKLIKVIKRDKAKVLVLYEFRNLHRSSPQYYAMKCFSTLLYDLELPFDYISPEQIQSGILTGREKTALILAGQAVMEPETAKAVKKFIVNGGIVISDCIPAISDGINRYPNPLLNELFAEVTKTGNCLPENDKDLALWKDKEKKIRKGTTCLLGKCLSDYIENRFKNRGSFLRKGVKDFLASHGINPVFKVVSKNGKFIPVTVVGYNDSGNNYVAMQRDYRTLDQEPRLFKVTGPKKAHVYDTRHGKYMGFAKSVDIELKPAVGAMLAFLNCEVTGIEIEGLPESCPQGECLNLGLRLRTSDSPPAEGVFVVNLTDPNDKEVYALNKQLKYSGGVAEIKLPLAFNDPVGKWTLEVTDVTTGIKISKEFLLIKNYK